MRIQKFFKKVDQFGKTLELNINGKKTKKSALGGIITLIVMSILIVYAAYSLHDQYVEFYTWDIVSYTKRLQMKDNEPFYIHEETGFMEGMRMEEQYNPYQFYNVDPSIGYFKSQLNTKDYQYWAPLVSCAN